MLETDTLLQKARATAALAVYPSLAGRRVLVTGGSSGIGEALVEAFVRQGSRVAFVDIDGNAANALVERLSGDAAFPPRFAQCDLRDVDSVKTVLAQVIEELGGIDVLVNNAANDDRHRIEDITPEYWDERMAVNLRHMFFVTQAAIPSMIEAGGGAIINFGSISWHLGMPDLILYQTAKAGIEGLTRALARDLGVHNIRVNTVVPGGVKTPRQDALWHDEEETARMLGLQCLKERVLPADVAAMVLFLASDDARMCTGHHYFVDAGWR
jgi:NAD(P)-dependent dehydrogenase (short-subunit alcohol dehydrogenase family)